MVIFSKLRFSKLRFSLIGIFIVLFSSLYFISCGKDISVTPPEAPPSTGFFSITSNPEGAAIYLNGKITGHVTPDTLSWLDAGRYDIKLRLPLYRDTLISISVSEQKKNSVSVDFTANPAMHGSVICKSNPDHAEIFLNGQPTQKFTPDTIKGLLPGVYRLRFKTFGCKDDSVNVTVKSSAVAQAQGHLQDTTIWMSYNTSNSGIPSNYITSVAVGGDGNVWIGTYDKGLASFDGKHWKVYNTSNSKIPSNQVTSLAVHYTMAGTTIYEQIYAGTPEGLAIYPITILSDGSMFSDFYVFNKTNSPLPDNNVTSVSVDNSNYVWVGTQKGIMLIPEFWDKMTAYDLSIFGESSVTCLAAVSSGYGTRHEVYIGLSNKGLGAFDFTGNSWVRYASPQYDLPNNQLRSIGAIGWGDAYFGCAGSPNSLSALSHMTSDGFENLQLGTKYNSYTSINARLDGSVWVCTIEGLFYRQSKGGSFTVYNETNSGLPSNFLSGVAFDASGRAWIATSFRGIALYKRDLDK